jgi:hypothetical protein
VKPTLDLLKETQKAQAQPSTPGTGKFYFIYLFTFCVKGSCLQLACENYIFGVGHKYLQLFCYFITT